MHFMAVSSSSLGLALHFNPKRGGTKAQQTVIWAMKLAKSSTLKHWKCLLREWTLCFEKFCAFSGTMPVLSRKEVTNVGILAGSAWSIGLVAFQEMTRRREGSDTWGYNDLYICSSGHNVSDYIECKGERVRDKSTASVLLDRAWQDARNLITEDPYSIKVGVAFCNFHFGNILDGSIDSEIDNLFRLIRDIPSDAIAWSFPQRFRNYRDNFQVIPVAVLLARVC
jgi:hypothetical protein